MKDNENAIDRDIHALSFLFILIIVLFLYGQSEYRNYKNVQLMGQAITVIQNQDVRIENLREGLYSMNKYADKLEGQLKQYSHLDKILKDLSLSK